MAKCHMDTCFIHRNYSTNSTEMYSFGSRGKEPSSSYQFKSFPVVKLRYVPFIFITEPSIYLTWTGE